MKSRDRARTGLAPTCPPPYLRQTLRNPWADPIESGAGRITSSPQQLPSLENAEAQVIAFIRCLRGLGVVEPVTGLAIFAGSWLAKKLARDWANSRKNEQ